MTNLMVSEDFHSLQGEGTWTGTPMHFIRLAGCNVGKHPSLVEWEIARNHDFPILKTGKTAYVCHTYDGRPFYCDTDFQHGDPLTIREFLDNTWEKHVCLTGGEPLLHYDKICELADECLARGIMLHVESSGTIKEVVPGWLTISPKEGFHTEMITWANEIKLLVNEGFKIEDVPLCILQHENVYIQPINYELTLNIENLNHCYEILRIKPDWKISFQAHKLINWR